MTLLLVRAQCMNSLSSCVETVDIRALASPSICIDAEDLSLQERRSALPVPGLDDGFEMTCRHVHCEAFLGLTLSGGGVIAQRRRTATTVRRHALRDGALPSV